ncbi:TonB-dependent receptor [Amniculibacterium aquaticum]|uniref:TonB-dependent receptor n=1 Tax=Amniculibacterium aquaticum TaxID=2479858 RepID=UPI000F5B1CC6|nr:TonB-dependent receptor [Amniculibacterium aquaticum]
MIHKIEISSLIKRKTLGLTFLLSAATMAFAQQKVGVSGKVVNKQNQAVPYASVTFSHASNKLYSDAVLTDEKGNYKIDLVPGNYNISIEAIDYKKTTLSNQSITKVGGLSPFTIEAEASITNVKTKDIQGVTITASSKPMKVEIDKKTYDVKSDLTAIGGNLQDVLQNVPSVTVDPDGTVNMRGSSNVKFLINGKPSALLGIDDGANALQSIPADQIDRIEVITNPSSKFEAAGTSGILNIILKKSKKVGFNGSVIGTLGYLPKTGLNANLNWRKGNLTYFLNGGGGYSERGGKDTTETIYKNFSAPLDPNQSALMSQSQYSKDDGSFSNYNLTTGLVYDFSDRTSFNLSGTVRAMNGIDDQKLTTTENRLNQAGTFQNFGVRKTDGDSRNLAFQGDIGLDHKFDDKGQNIAASLSLQTNNSHNNSEIIEHKNSLFLLKDTTKRNSTNNSVVGKVDYELPIGENSKLEAGYRLDINKNIYDGFVDSTIPNAFMPNYNNSTDYKEMFNAGYVQFKSKIGKFGYQLGLRNENSQISIDYKNQAGQKIDKTKNYNDIFPSVYMTYDVTDKNQVLVNYTRRIDRPRSFFMVPFSRYSNNQNIFEGNIDMNPSYVDSYELGYLMSSKKFTLNPTLYFRHATGDDKFLVYRPDERESVFFTKPINLGTNDSYGLDLNFTYDPVKWLRLMGNVDLYGYKTEGIAHYDIIDQNGNPSVGTMDFTGDGFSSRARLSTTFKFDKTFSFQMQGMYRGGTKTANQERKPSYSMNLGLSKTIWNGDGTISANLSDVFNTRGMKTYSFNSDYDRNSHMQWMPRQFTISLTYKFKQGEKVEIKKPKKDINNNYEGGDEQGGGGM